jgi:16S rRNA (cytidine1402-2'-O)-methyltransferase
MTGTLFLIGSPIGNVEDISDRLINSITNAKTICVEDEIRFSEFCKENNLNYTAEILDISYSVGNDREFNNKDLIIDKLLSGEDVHIISDEGMPGICDPGEIIAHLAVKNNIPVKVSPGPSTIIAAAITANVGYTFSFEGFPPNNENGHEEYLWERLLQNHKPMIFLLQNPQHSASDNEEKVIKVWPTFSVFYFIDKAIEKFGKDKNAVFCINLTYPNERVIRGTLEKIKTYIYENQSKLGKMCIVVDGKDKKVAVN